MKIMNERIKAIRKSFNMTQQEFADRIGVKRNTVATYEMGRSAPSDAALSLICREFNINEEWLRTGEGEMFAPEPEDEIEAIIAKYEMDDLEATFTRKYLALGRAQRKEVSDFVKKLFAQYAADEAARNSRTTDRPERTMSREELHAELDRQLDLEEKTEERSSVLADIG